MRYLFLTLLFVVGFSQSVRAGNNIDVVFVEKFINLTVQDVYELEKTKTPNLKNFIMYLNEFFLKGVTGKMVSVRDIKTDIRYCFYNIKANEIHDKLLEEYKRGIWSYNTKYILAEMVLVFEQCMPKELFNRQEYYDIFKMEVRENLMNMSEPVLQTRGSISSDYYLY